MELSMGTQSLTADENRPRVRPNEFPAAKSRLLRYQVNVIATDVADVVQSVGGWLFDRSMAGWDVNVLLANHNDTRPLRILGVRTFELHPTLLSIGSGAERAVGIAIAADLLGTDECIDAEIRDALQSGEVEVTLWGESRFGERATAVQYRLSAAARIFKDCALAAAMLTDVSVAPVETLFCSGYRPVDSHLIPVS
jgi:hypothetical protein